jgi:hypothetical protein
MEEALGAAEVADVAHMLEVVAMVKDTDVADVFEAVAMMKHRQGWVATRPMEQVVHTMRKMKQMEQRA